MSPDKKENKKGGARLARPDQTPGAHGEAGAAKPSRAKRPKRVRTARQKVLLGLYIAVTVIAAIIVALFIAYKVLIVKPEVKPRPQVDPPVESGGVIPSAAPIEESDRKTDFFTFLVIGRDTGGGGNTDTIMLVAYDIPNQKLAVMSIPRDTMVNVPWEIKRINSVYNVYGGGEKGIQALYKEVSQLVGFQPDFDVVVEWDGFGKLVDAIGGVDFYVPLNMYYDDPTQDLHIHISKGQQHLNGEQAMQVIRFRKNNDNTGYVTGDIGRIETQQAFMKEVIKQCLTASNIISNVGKYARIFTECVDTDLTVNNLAYFAKEAIEGGLNVDNVTFITMPGDYNGTAWSPTYQNYQSYVLPYGDELIKVVNEHFNPYLEDRTASQLDIMTVNRDGSLSSSTGVVEDSKAAKPPVKPTPKPQATPEPEPEPTESPVVSESPAPTDTPPAGTTPAPGESAAPGGSPTPSESPAVSAPPAENPTPAPTAPPAEPTPTAQPTPEPTPEPTPAPAPSDGDVILPPEAYE